jgi:hypothetical protein
MIPKPKKNKQGNVVGDFYPLQREELMAMRKAKLINNTAFVHLALRYENPFCDKAISLIPKEFALRWQIPESSIYEAIGKLKSCNAISIKSGKLTIEWVDSQEDGTIDSQQDDNSDNPEKIMESQNKLRNPRINSESSEKITESQNKLRNPRINSESSENQPPETTPSKASEVLHTIQTYQIYTDSLSEAQRESFLEFGRKKALELPKPRTLISNWIKAHWEDLRSQWEKSQGRVSSKQASKWEKHPQREEWLEKIRQLGPAGFQAEDMPNQKIRREFYIWADANNLIWGNET